MSGPAPDVDTVTGQTPRPTSLPQAGLAALRRKRGQVRAMLWFEQLWPAAWPALGALAAYAIAALLGLPALLSLAAREILGLLVPLLAVLLLWRGLRPVRRPGAAAVDRRLETASGLRHRPLLVLADRPAVAGVTFSPFSGRDLAGPDPADFDPVWQAHVARVVAQLGRLRTGLPRPGLPARDRRALRGLLAVSLVAALVIAGPDAVPRLAAAFTPALPSGPPPPPPVLQAWITPPPSTGMAPVFLHPGAPALVSIPAGSKLQVSLTGGSTAPSLLLGKASQPFAALDPTSWHVERTLAEGGRLSVRRGRSEIAAWTLAVVADAAPVVAWAEPPGPAADASGGRPGDTRTRLPWRVSHPYGVAGLTMEMRLDARPGDASVSIPVPLPGAPRQAHGIATPDLAALPWAGLPVTATLVGHDGQGTTGRSETARFTLPERAFHDPLARALIAERRRLTLAPEQRDTVAAELRALALPLASDGRTGSYLGISTIGSLLEEEDGPNDAAAQAQARLWEMALALDAGDAERSSRLVEQKREQVRQQLDEMRRDPAKQADPKQQAELKARIQAMQEAVKQHLQDVLEQARKDGTLQPQDPQAEHQDASDLDRLMQEMEDAAREGRMDDAARAMDELQKQMQALDDAAKSSSQQAHGKQPAKPGEERAQTARDAVQDLLKREGGLLDHAQSRDRSQTGALSPDDQDGDQSGLPDVMRQPPQDPQASGPDDQQQGDQQQGDAQQSDRQAGDPSSDEGQSSKSQGGAGAPPSTMHGQPGVDGASPSGGKPRQSTPDSRREAAQPQSPGEREGRTQRAMRRALGELMQQFGDSAGSVPKSLGDADQSMQQAESALKAGRDGEARDAEQRAVADLRKGGQEMGQTMQRQFGLSDARDGQPGKGKGTPEGEGESTPEGEGGSGTTPGQSGQAKGAQRDPLGRLTQDGGHGVSDGDDVHVPDQIEQARSRDIQDELRRRSADRARPQPELDYIGRLLKPF